MNTIEVEASKDLDAAHPVASAWRATFREIVGALIRRDYGLSCGVEHVSPVSAKVAEHVQQSISDFGEHLVELPDETWRTSVAQWMGTHWDVLVDLWTAESGSSDLVLSARVRESGDGFQVEINSVYVP